MEKMWYNLIIKLRGEKRWKEDKFISIYLSISYLFNISRGKVYQRASMKGVGMLFLCPKGEGMIANAKSMAIKRDGDIG